jgi:GntR family transcriptional regulator
MQSRSEKPRPPFRFRLDAVSGVPVYRQIIDQVCGALASSALVTGDQLPTVRQLAVDLAINPNTVVRAYRELELGGLIETQQGSGTFIGEGRLRNAPAERERQLNQIVEETIARTGASGFSLDELIAALRATKERIRKERS